MLTTTTTTPTTPTTWFIFEIVDVNLSSTTTT